MSSNFFEYQDFPKIDRSQIVITTGLTLQTGSSVEQLKDGVMPYDYASLELNEYVTSEPKKLAPLNSKLGLISNSVTDANGYNVGSDVNGAYILIDLNGTFSFSGVTLGFVNACKQVRITYFDSQNIAIKNQSFEVSKELEFLGFVAESVRYVKINLWGTQKPYHFLGVNRIDLGQLRIFDVTNLVDANITTHFDVDGSTLQYDVAELTIFTGKNENDYLFQKKQPIVYKDANGNVLHKFYIDKGESDDGYTVDLTAYDSIYLLEDEYLGGIYGFEVNNSIVAPTTTYKTLIDDIMQDTDVSYKIDADIENLEIKGYIPVCTKRKALELLCKGTNTRVFKRNGDLYFKHIEKSLDTSYDETQIVENPTVKKNTKVSKLTVIEHEYQKETEAIELYNWYLKQGENTMQLIKFDVPVYKVLAYEVTGTDENGIDIVDVSSGSSQNVIFYHAPIGSGSEAGDDNVCNYVIIKSCNTSNKVVLKGWEIKDDTNSNTFYERIDIDVNADYEEIEVEDVTITAVNGGVKSVAKTLFGIETQQKLEEFSLVEVDKPNVGDAVSTPMIESPVTVDCKDKGGTQESFSYRTKITEIEDDLSGIYKVVAR